MHENDDYEADRKFGEWLRSKRLNAGMELEEAAKATGVTTDRLKSLEIGYSERGINRTEAERIAKAYQVELSEVLQKAGG